MALGSCERRARSRRVVYVTMSGSAGGGRGRGRVVVDEEDECRGAGERDFSAGRSCAVISWKMSRAIL